MQQSGLNFTFQLVRIRNSPDVHRIMKLDCESVQEYTTQTTTCDKYTLTYNVPLDYIKQCRLKLDWHLDERIIMKVNM